MATKDDIRELHRHLQTSRGGGDLILAVESTSEEELLADGDYSAYSYKIANIPDDGLGHLLSNLKQTVQDLVDDFTENRKMREYDIRSVDQDLTPIQHISVDEIPNQRRFEPVFSGRSIEGSTTYKENYPDFQSYRISINPVIIGFRIFTRRQLIETEDHYRMYESDGEYSKFDEDIVTLPDGFDCIYYDDEIIILNPRNFEKIFDYFDTYLVHADNVLTTIKNSNINIKNFDVFVDSIRNDRRALRKMKEVEDIGLYAEISQTDVERVVKEYELSIEIDESEQDWEIVIPDMRKKWDVIRMLNDDHLRSELTDDRYQVYGKDRR